MRLGEAGNTYNIALYEIEKRQYKVSCEYDEDCDLNDWRAEKGDMLVFASCPLTLLALVVLADTYGENWNKVTTEDIYQRIAYGN